MIKKLSSRWGEKGYFCCLLWEMEQVTLLSRKGMKFISFIKRRRGIHHLILKEQYEALLTEERNQTIFYFIFKTPFSFFRKWEELFNRPPIKGLSMFFWLRNWKGWSFLSSKKKIERSSFYWRKKKTVLFIFCFFFYT